MGKRPIAAIQRSGLGTRASPARSLVALMVLAANNAARRMAPAYEAADAAAALGDVAGALAIPLTAVDGRHNVSIADPGIRAIGFGVRSPKSEGAARKLR